MSARRAIQLTTLIALLSGVSHAQSPDAARIAPANSLVYCGWGADEHPSVLFRVGRSLVSALASRSRAAEAPILPPLLDLADRLFSHAGGVCLTEIDWADGDPRFSALLVSFAGSDGDHLSERLERLIRGVAATATIESREIGGVPCRSVRLGDSPLVLFWCCDGDLWLASLGEPAMAAAIASARGRAASSLAESEGLRFCRAKTGSGLDAADPTRSLHLEFRADIPALAARLRPFVDAIAPGGAAGLADALRGLGLANTRAIYYRSHDTPRGQLSRFFLHSPGSPGGVLRLWQQAPLTDDDLRVIPADAYWAMAFNFDFARAWGQLIDTAGDVDPAFAAQLESSLSLLDTLLGMSVADDWLAAFGETWAVYDAPANGGFLLSGTVFVIDAKDPDAIDRVYRKFIGLFTSIAEPALPGVNIAVRDFPADGRQFRSAVIGGLPAPVALTWTFVERKIIIGLTPQAVRAAAAQIDAATRRNSLLDNPEFRSGRSAIPPGASSISFTNARHLASLLYPFVNHYALALGSMASVGGAGVNLAEFPTLDETLADCHSVVGGAALDDDGILYCQVGSGLSIWNLAYGGLLASVFVMPLAAEVAPLAPPESPQPPAFQPLPASKPARGPSAPRRTP